DLMVCNNRRCTELSSLILLLTCRCQRWVENCRRADLEDKTPDQLNKHYRLCAKHFETSMICRSVSKTK
uniref:THAP-type domain-containing protein n=1 Tax=Falco tinnunculus TaxID=100819 RepID=A0A8C4XJ50_FALTI